VEKLEAAIEDYYYFAPFSGTVLAMNKKVGEKVLSEECVAQIAPFQSYFAEFKVQKEDLDLLKLKDEVALSLNKKQVKGRVIKISRSKDSAYATIECSLSTTLSTRGEKITIQRLRKSEYLYIPCHLVRNDSVWICRHGQSMKIHATILEWKKDSVAIKELNPGDLVLRKRQKSGVISCP
jgi:DNA-directed RNA polymerase subunit H (RpoH/RPB5)